MNTGVLNSATPNSAPTFCDAQISSHLLLADLIHARFKRLLPGVVLDDAHAVDDLAEDVDASIRALHELEPNHEQRLRDFERQRRGDEDAQEAHERAPADDEVEHRERGDDEDGRAPQVMKQLEHVLELVDVVRHERHDLPRRLLLRVGDSRVQKNVVHRSVARGPRDQMLKPGGGWVKYVCTERACNPFGESFRHLRYSAHMSRFRTRTPSRCSA